jgi:hypothetical protein
MNVLSKIEVTSVAGGRRDERGDYGHGYGHEGYGEKGGEGRGRGRGRGRGEGYEGHKGYKNNYHGYRHD